MLDIYSSIRDIPYGITIDETDLPVRKILVEYIYKVKNDIKLLSDLQHDDMDGVNCKEISLIKKNKLAYFVYDGCFFICRPKNKKRLMILVTDYWTPISKEEHMIFGCLFGHPVESIINFLRNPKYNFTVSKKEVVDCYKKYALETYKKLPKK